MNKDELRNKLLELISSNKDKEAAQIFRESFASNPLITDSGKDEELDFVANPVGFMLYDKGEFSRAVEWWKSVLESIDEYEKTIGVVLHKGLPLHNKSLSLIRLNRLDEALQTIEAAFREDKRNFPDEAEVRPAFHVLCFLKPIVERGHWNKDIFPDSATDLLFKAFDDLYKAIREGKLKLDSIPSLGDLVQDEELKGVLLRRYKKIKESSSDVVMNVIYAGSILEGVLGNLLSQKPEESIKSFEKLARARREFIFYITLSDESFERILETRLKKKSIKRWDFEQMLSVAKDIGLFDEYNGAVLYVLGSLLRDYRNLIHPTNLETIGNTNNSSIVFDVNNERVNMVVTALDIVLTLLHKPEDYMNALLTSDMDSGQHHGQVEPEQTTTTSGIYTSNAKASMASPSRVRMEDIAQIDLSQPTKTIQTTTKRYSTPPAMGSSTTTTLPIK